MPGCGNGRKLGFRTANMKLYDPLKLIPYNGVYAVKVYVEDKSYNGVCNIGYRPTWDDSRGLTIEAHIIDFNEDIYGLDINLEFVGFLRDEKKFSSLDELCTQLKIDVKEAMKILK